MFCTMVNTVNSLHRNFLIVMILLLYINGHQGFFVKHSSGLCLQSESTPFTKGRQTGPVRVRWGPIYFTVFQSTCLHPDAQFRFYEKYNVLYNIGKNGTFLTRHRSNTGGYRGGKYQIFHSPQPVSITNFIYTPRFIMKQTQSGSLKLINSAPPYCATSGKSIIPVNGDYVIQTTNCADEAEQKFTFGSVTNESKNMSYVHCSSTQIMKVVHAEYGEFNNEIFDYNKHADCSLPSTCIVKEQCDNQISCNMNVKSSLFKHVPCSGQVKRLYMEYMCVDSLTTPITNVDDVRLSSEGSANQGFVEVFENSVWKKIADQNMERRKARDLCKYLGFSDHDGEVVLKDVKPSYKILSGDLSCRENSCCVYLYSSTPAKEPILPFVSCKICSKELKLNDTSKFPDSIFKASHSSGHLARIANSGWCFSQSNTQYLQIDLALDYVITQIATFGNGDGTKWMTSYILKYSRKENKLDSDGIRKSLKANINGFDVAFQNLSNVYARYLKIIPEGAAGCLRIEVCGYELIPGPPEKKVIGKIKSSSVKISWKAPVIKGEGQIFYIITEKQNLFSEINQTQLEKNLTGLKPYTSYVVKVSSTNRFGKKENAHVNLPFDTTQAVPDGPPLEVVFYLRRKTSFTVSWKSPEKKFWNGIIIKYKVCYSTAASAENCFEETSKTSTITNLQPATKYFVKVAAGTTAGFGVFSNKISKITNQGPVVPAKKTSYSLSLSLKKTQSNIKTILVIIQAAQSSTKSSDSYQSNELKPYSPGSSSPYVTAVFSTDDLPLNIIIGDGTSYKLGGTSYINQRLNENTDYIVFIRFIEIEKDFYSTEWSNSITTYNRPAVTGITAGNITAKTASISWTLQPITGPDAFTYLLITVKEIVFSKVITRQDGKNRYTIENLKPYSNYVVGVQPGNTFEVGETVSRNFMTHEAVPSGPPLNVKVAVQSSSSLLISWKAPELQKQNGVITNYTICLSRNKEETCFQLYVINNNKYLITNLRFSTKYLVRVCASTRAGCGNYSLIQEAFTDGKPLSKPVFRTANTLSFLSQKPNENFGYFEVIAVYLSQNTSPARSPNTYTSQELSHYSEVKDSSESIPYIAAVFNVYDEICQMFTLGDGINYSKPRIIADSSEVESYFNGPLKEDGTYSVFQRFYKDWNNYYSTGWSPPASTNTLERCAEKAASKSPKRSSETSLIVGIAISLCLNIVFIALVIYLTLKVYRARSQNVPSDNVVTKVENRAFNDDIYEEPEFVKIAENAEISKTYEELNLNERGSDELAYQSLTKEASA